MPRRCARPRPASSRGIASFPWEDWRDGRPEILDQTIVPLLEQWAKSGKTRAAAAARPRERMRHCFGVGGSPWDEEKVLDRYELLYEAGLVEEARRDGREAALPRSEESRRSARRCGSTIAAFWRPRSRGCAPS